VTAGAWVVVPTYDERENLEPLVTAVLDSLGGDVHVLVVDDDSPDGTGALADRLADRDPRVRVLHRRCKEGIGPAYKAGMHAAIRAGASAVVQMDCDFSHDPAAIPSLLGRLDAGADLVLGARYVPGGGTENWPLRRRIISRGGTLTARLALGLPYGDLTGGFKAWRPDLLRRINLDAVEASGYGFQVETTWRAHCLGARIEQVPIIFRDRSAGQSKMTGGIVVEALAMLVRLRRSGSPQDMLPTVWPEEAARHRPTTEVGS
jgi:dolichol-phosphate mannosyltransferase